MSDFHYLDWNDVEYEKPTGVPVGFHVSARAIVRRDDGRILLVKPWHDSRFETPGGTVEAGELVRAAAMREVLEETGLKVVCEAEPMSWHERGFYNKNTGKFYQSFILIFNAHLADGQNPDQITIGDKDEIEKVTWLDPRSLMVTDIHACSQSAFKKFMSQYE